MKKTKNKKEKILWLTTEFTKLMKRCNFTMQDVADATRINRNTVWNYLNPCGRFNANLSFFADTVINLRNKTNTDANDKIKELNKFAELLKQLSVEELNKTLIN